MPAKITRDVLEAYLNCRYKGHLALTGERAEPSAYQAFRLRNRLDVRSRAVAAIHADHAPEDLSCDVELSLAVLKRGMTYLLDVRMELARATPEDNKWAAASSRFSPSSANAGERSIERSGTQSTAENMRVSQVQPGLDQKAS